MLKVVGGGKPKRWQQDGYISRWGGTLLAIDKNYQMFACDACIKWFLNILLFIAAFDGQDVYLFTGQ